MNYAILTLESRLETLENNEPICRREGRIEQADAELANANQVRQALIVLRAVESAYPTGPNMIFDAGDESGGGTVEPPDEPEPPVDKDPK